MRKGWEYQKLGEVLETTSGGTPSKSHKEYYVGGTIPWLRSGEVSKGDIYDAELYITEEGLKKSSAKLFPIDTVLIAMYGATVGQVGILKSTMCTNQAICGILPNKDFHPNFLKYVLLANKKNYLKQAIGGAQPNISQQVIKSTYIPIVKFSEQESVVSELDKINELIRLKKEQLKDFDNLAQSLFYEMFGDPVENEKGWEVKKLNEIVSDNCSISYGIVQPGDGIENGVPVVRPVDMTGTFVYRQGLKNTTKEISDSYKRTILKGNEILMCVRGTTGLIAMASSELRGCNVTRGITPIECGKSCNKWFIYYQISNSSIQQYIAEYTRGIALKQINMKDVRDIPLCLPPLPLQHLFAHRIEQIEHQKSEVQKAITDLETLLASRMQYWFE